MPTPLEHLEQFERDMANKGAGRAPNGADYRLLNGGNANGLPQVERTYQGYRDIIVGFGSTKFTTLAEARGWAIQDGRYEWAGRWADGHWVPGGKPIHERKMLA